jgi:hypothetical protein
LREGVLQLNIRAIGPMSGSMAKLKTEDGAEAKAEARERETGRS